MIETAQKLPQQANKNQKQAKSKSFTVVAWEQFRKHPLARISLGILGVLYFLAAFADFFAPYKEGLINTSLAFQPPHKIYWRDENGSFSRPYIYSMKGTIDRKTYKKVWEEDKSEKYHLQFFVTRGGIRDKYVPFPVNLIPEVWRQAWGIKPWASLHFFGLEDEAGRGRFFLWGSDDLGRDVFGQILYGSRVSLSVGILASFVALIIGMLLGGLAGYFGKWVDEIIMRTTEALSAIPEIPLLITLSAIFLPLNLPSATTFLLIVCALSVIGWGGIARTVRGQVLSLRERDYAVAAKSLGASDLRVILTHLLPQTLTYAIVLMSLLIPGYIISEAVLSFYGLGIRPPATSWGQMLSTAQAFAGVNGLGERWWIFIPGVFIFISVLTWNLLGDGVRDAFDPKSRK
ncbi:MAG: ABC transporter permease [Trueperaceae bacterium]